MIRGSAALPVLYLKAFGFYGRNIPGLSDAKKVATLEGGVMEETLYDADPTVMSVFGLPIIMPVKIDDTWLPN